MDNTFPLDDGAGPVPPDMALSISQPFDRLVSALAQANLQISNPRKNRQVTVTSRRRGITYSYSYTTLDKVLDALRAPLAKHGLVIIQLPSGQELQTILAHDSGQWVRAKMRIHPAEDDMQGYASALTSARRLTLQTIFAIAGEDDDDGHAAEGNEAIPLADARAIAVQNVASDNLHPLIEMARHTSAPSQAAPLMQLWLDRLPEIRSLRASPEIEAQQTWGAIVGEVSGAIQRCFGPRVGGAWKSLALASEVPHLDAIAHSWAEGWGADLSRVAQEYPSSFDALLAHRAAVERHIRHQPAIDHAFDAEDAALAAGNAASRDAPPSVAGAAQDADVRAQGALAVSSLPPRGAPPFCAVILDAGGDPVSEEIADPTSWAAQFDMAAAPLSGDDLEAMLHHNSDSLIEAAKHRDAHAILRPYLTPLEPPTFEAVPAPLSSLDGSGYVRLIRESLEQVLSPEGMAAWEEVNSDVYLGPAVTGKVQLLVLREVAAKKRALGIRVTPRVA